MFGILSFFGYIRLIVIRGTPKWTQSLQHNKSILDHTKKERYLAILSWVELKLSQAWSCVDSESTGEAFNYFRVGVKIIQIFQLTTYKITKKSLNVIWIFHSNPVQELFRTDCTYFCTGYRIHTARRIVFQFYNFFLTNVPFTSI